MTRLPDDTVHRLALYRLIGVARGVMAADGADADLARHWGEMSGLSTAVSDAAIHAHGEGRGRCRDAWPLLAQACTSALRRICMEERDDASREDVARWQSIVGALYPHVLADWRAWRDATSPKMGGM